MYYLNTGQQTKQLEFGLKLASQLYRHLQTYKVDLFCINISIVN